MSADPAARPATAVILAGGDSRRLGRDKALVEIGGRALLVRVLDAAAPAVDEVLVVSGERDVHARALREAGWAAGAGSAGPAADAARPRAGKGADPRDGGATADRPRLRLLADRRPGRGPLAGLEVGLGAARSEACLVLACDLPFLPPELPARLLRELARWRGAGDGGPDSGAGTVDAGGEPAAASSGRPRAVVPVVDGRRQSLCAAVERRAGEVAAACLDAGEASVGAWLARLEVREAPIGRLAAGHEEEGAARLWLLDVDTPEALEEARHRHHTETGEPR